MTPLWNENLKNVQRELTLNKQQMIPREDRNSEVKKNVEVLYSSNIKESSLNMS